MLFRGRPGARAPLLDRLQIGAGLVPLAGYLILHLLTQASALGGHRAYAVWAGGEPPPFALGLEVLGIYLPLLVHVGLGLRRLGLASGAEAPVLAGETLSHPALVPAGLVRILQPLSGAALLLFVLFHVAEFRWPLWTGSLAPSDYYPELCASLSSTRWGGVPSVAIGYLLGIAAAALHCAHGLYRGALRLGLVSAAAERVWARCCGALGLALFGLGALIVIDLATGSVLIHLPGS